MKEKGQEAEGLVEFWPRALCLAQLTVEDQSRVSRRSRMNCAAAGRMAWRGGSKGVSESVIPQTVLPGFAGARP